MFSKNKLFSTTGITIGLIIPLIFGVGANADNSINENVNVKTELDLACVAAAKEAGVDTYSKDCIVSYSVKEVETKSISPLDILLEKGLTR